MARVDEGSYRLQFLPDTHTLIHEWNEPSPAAAHHRNLAGIHFLSHRGQEAELAWVAGYIRRWYARPKAVIQATDSAATGNRTHDHLVASPTP